MRYRILASLGLALLAAPVVADGQQPPPDTTRAGVIRAQAGGEVALTANRGLTRAQVRQLQESLRAAGCNPGTPDGIFGPRTRQALACVRRQRGIESTNANDVLRALDLSFTLTDSVAVAGDVAMTGERGQPRYSDPTFVRDTGVMRINTDTMPAGMMESSAVFVPSVTRSRGLYLRETSLERRSTEVLVPRDTTGAAARDSAERMRRDSAAVTRRVTPPPARRDTTPAIRGDTVPARRELTPSARREAVPAMRRDTSARVRADTLPPTRADTARPMRTDTTRLLRVDTTRTPLPDSTLRRMRDEILFSLPPRADSARDTLRRDSTRTRADSVRPRPDSTRTPPDTTRRRPPPPR